MFVFPLIYLIRSTRRRGALKMKLSVSVVSGQLFVSGDSPPTRQGSSGNYNLDH